MVTAKIAGIESTAKIRSVTSTSTRTVNSGVASRTPLRRTKNFAPSYESVLGISRRVSARIRLFAGSPWSLRCRNIWMPVSTRKAPNR